MVKLSSLLLNRYESVIPVFTNVLVVFRLMEAMRILKSRKMAMEATVIVFSIWCMIGCFGNTIITLCLKKEKLR